MPQKKHDDEAGAGLATTGTDVVEIIGDDELEIVEAAVRGNRDVELTVVSPDEAADAIVARILEATSAEEAFTPQKTTPAGELFGVPLEFTGVQWLNSKYQEGAGVYALAQATRLDDGERLLVTTSARNALAQLLVCAKLGAFPQRGTFVEGGETTSGFRPQWIEGIGPNTPAGIAAAQDAAAEAPDAEGPAE